MKKFAMKGLVILAICVALCMFFAGTVRTIVTPKVKIVYAKNGRLEQSVALKGVLTFPEEEELRVDAARGQSSVVVSKVLVRAGYEVKQGDVLVELEMSDYDEQLKKLSDDYAEKLKKLADLDVKNREHNRTNQRNTAYEAMLAAQKELIVKKVAFEVQCETEGKTMPEDVKVSALEEYIAQQNGSELMRLAAAGYAEAQKAATRAENNLFDLLSNKKTKGKEGVYDYLKDRAVAEAELDKVERDMVELGAKKAKLSSVVAPHDGYVMAVSVKQGDSYDGKTPIVTMNKKDVSPVLRADVSESRKAIEENATVTIKNDYQSVDTKVVATGIDLSGKRYVDVQITDELIQMTGGVYRLMQGETEMKVSYRAKEATTLLPASAVRSEGENENYVWQIRQKYGGFTGNHMEIEKVSVTVLERAGKVVSIGEDMSNVQIADMEDRAIKDGDTVMEYVS